MVQLFKVMSVGDVEPIQRKENGVLVNMTRLQNGENAVKRTVELRQVVDYQIDQSGKVSYFYDTHYVELIGSRAEECLLGEGMLVLADLRFRQSDYKRENCYVYKILAVEENDL